MKYDLNKAVKEMQPGVLYDMCLKVKDVNTGEIYVVDYPECLSHSSMYQVLDTNVLVPVDKIY